MDSERVERLEKSLSEVHAKLDLILKQLSDQTRPLQVMENHVYNVEAVAARVPFLSNFFGDARVIRLTDVFGVFRLRELFGDVRMFRLRDTLLSDSPNG